MYSSLLNPADFAASPECVSVYVVSFPSASVLYVDTSVYYGIIHLMLCELIDEDTYDMLKDLKLERIYLMHLDDVDAAKELIKNKPLLKIVDVV